MVPNDERHAAVSETFEGGSDEDNRHKNNSNPLNLAKPKITIKTSQDSWEPIYQSQAS